MPTRQKYRLLGHTVDSNGESVEPHCADITFVNYGTNTLLVNNFIRIPPPATAGQYNFFTIAGNTGEEDTSIYNIQFSGAGTSVAIVMWRVYVS